MNFVSKPSVVEVKGELESFIGIKTFLLLGSEPMMVIHSDTKIHLILLKMPTILYLEN